MANATQHPGGVIRSGPLPWPPFEPGGIAKGQQMRIERSGRTGARLRTEAIGLTTVAIVSPIIEPPVCAVWPRGRFMRRACVSPDLANTA